MTNHTDSVGTEAVTWQLNALTEALGDLTLTVSNSLSVGRGSDNDVVLGSKQISRNHALLSVLNGRLYVKDLDSSNGTFINDKRIEKNKSIFLKTDDTLGFASFSFQIGTPVAAKGDDVQDESLAPVTMDDSVTNIITDTDEAITQPVAETSVIEAQAVVAPVIEERTITEASETHEPVVKETGIEEILPTAAVTQVAEPVVQDAIVKETAITEVLSAAKNVQVAATESVEKDLSTEKLKLQEAPVMQEEQAIINEKPITAVDDKNEHDKTTQTALQEEADPDILRAKQAATGQLSGTANLGLPKDIGTEGNNALDQATHNTATAGQIEKKPSGGWFIWVFIAIIIIGIALWLFNMG